METFSRGLAYALLALLGSLPLGCLFAGLIYGLLAFAFGQTGISEGLGLGLVISIPAILVGVIPAFLFGAPVYAFVASRGYANYLSTAVIGALPSLLSWHDLSGMGLAALYGVSVACLTHLFLTMRCKIAGYSANNWSKPKPLRGSA
jgi:hypothetical protein